MTIKTIKPSGGDFTSLSAWVASLPATLTAPEQADIYNFGSGGLVETGGVPFIGFTTTAINKLILNVPVGERYTGVAHSGAYVTNVGGGAGTTTVRLGTFVDYFDINWLEIESVITGTSALHWATAVDAGNLWTINHGIIHSLDSSPIGVTTTASSNQIYRDALFYSGGAARVIDARGAGSVEVSNCNFYSQGGDFVTLLDGAATVTNSYAGGGSNTAWGFAGSPTGSFNASDDTSATATFTNSINSVAGASVFASVTANAEDFRLLSGANALVDAGTTLAAVTDDIIGTARPQGAAYDIGAWELVVAPPPPPTGPILFARSIM